MYTEKQIQMLKTSASNIREFTLADVANFCSALVKCEAGTEDKLTEAEARLLKSLVSNVPATFSKEQGEVTAHTVSVADSISKSEPPKTMDEVTAESVKP